MKDVSQVTACVLDHGLFLPLAIKLGEQFKRVLYQTPWEKGFPLLNDCIIGDGFENVERCNCFLPMLDEIDVFVFPDIQHSAMQLHLESLGKPVWGSRDADSIEMNRVKFLNLLKTLGLNEPTWEQIQGVSELREHLKDKTDKYIKISKFRGSMETWHWRDYKSDSGKLDELAVTFGTAKELIPFLVFDPVDADVEVGYDGYCIDGKFPSLGIQGYEAKDRGFLCRIQNYDSLPEQVLEVNDAFSTVLKEYRYRNFWSTEIRVSDGEGVFIDPCCRCPSPSTEAQLQLYDNIGEIIWHGAHGELVDPVVSNKFACSAVMTVKERKGWVAVDFPKDLKPYIACGCSCEIDGVTAFPPGEDKGPEIGWLTVSGNTPSKCIESLIELSKQVPEGVEVHTDSIAELINEIDSAKDEGIEFSKNMPEPSIVVET